MDETAHQEVPFSFDRIYTFDEVVALFELSDGDYKEAILERLPHSNFGPTIVFSGAAILKTLAFWGLSAFLSSVRDDRVSDRDKN